MQKHYYLYVFVVHIVVSISKRILLLNSLVLLQISFGKLHDPLLHTYTTTYEYFAPTPPHSLRLPSGERRIDSKKNKKTLHQLNPTAAAYLRNTPSQFWVAAFIPKRRYGEDTSNIVERINFDFKALRELPIVELLQTL